VAVHKAFQCMVENYVAHRLHVHVCKTTEGRFKGLFTITRSHVHPCKTSDNISNSDTVQHRKYDVICGLSNKAISGDLNDVRASLISHFRNRHITLS